MELVFEGEDVLELFLEDSKDSVENCFVFHSQIIFQLFIHRLYFQNDDLAGLVALRPSSEYSGLIPFRIVWFDLFAVQGTLSSNFHEP